MPGRVSRSSVQISKGPAARKKHQKRNLEAFAIASKQNPDRNNVRRHRLGDAEDDGPRHKRQRLDEDDEPEDVAPTKSARRVPQRSGVKGDTDEFDLDGGSDSEGNEWRMGVVEEEDDSDIDSEEAFGESDEERFAGFTFRGSTSWAKSGKRGPTHNGGRKDAGDIDLDEGEEEEGEEEDDFGDEGVDLATMLDESDEETEKIPRKPTNDDLDMDGEAGGSDDAQNDDDEEDEEEGSDEDSPSEFGMSDADEDGDPEKLLQLQDLVSSLQTDELTGSKRSHRVDVHESSTPSEFGLTSSQKLTVADLLPSVTDSKLKRSLKLLTTDAKPSKRNGIPGKVEAPLPKRQQDRLDREAAFKMAKETLSRWVDTVKHNRRAEHLIFPLQDPDDTGPALQSLTKPSTKPFNDLEATIQNILVESGRRKDGESEEKQIQAQEELAMKKMPIEEVEARRAELRRQRHLLFAEEIRAKRIKKIKSKAYRRVHRKERERNAQAERDALAAAGANFSDEEREQNDRRRAEERLGAKHRESKWAKGVKKIGRAAWDEEARSGVNEMARRNEELRRRIEGKDVRDEDEDDTDISSADSDDDDVDGEEHSKDHRLQRQLGRVSESTVIEDGSKSKLGSMKFMQRAEAARKVRNDENVERMRRELAGEDSLSEDEDEAQQGRMIFGPTAISSNAAKASQKERRDELDFGPFSDDDDGNVANHNEDVEIVTERPKAANGSDPSQRKDNNQSNKARQQRVASSKNPWLNGDQKSLVSKDRNIESTENPWLAGPRKSKTKSAMSSDFVLNLEDPPPEAVTVPSNKSRTTETGAPTDTNGWKTVTLSASNGEHDSDASDSDEEQRTPFALRNSDLIKRAFAGDDVLATFTAEKHVIASSENETTTTTTLPGWGSWTGPGISAKSVLKNTHPSAITTTITPGVKPDARRDRKLDRVAINERRVKKNSKYLATTLPFPFENRMQYERSLRAPVGPEWVTKEVFQDRTRPRVVVRQGIVGAMERPLV